MMANEEIVHPDLRAISFGPSQWVVRLKSFVVNGFRFRIKAVDVRKKNQNYGICVAANTPSYSSTRDRRPVTALVDFYGVVTDIIKLDFGDGRTCVLFDCEWVDNHVGSKVDGFGFKLINFNKKMNTKDTFVLATQAKQVFYIEDPLDPAWHVVVDTQPRDLYDMSPVETADLCDVQTLDERRRGGDEINPREDIEGTTIDERLSPLRTT